MSPALTRLLDGIIDYAGLFPPARLTMEDAVTNFLAYQGGPEAWIVSRFVCPASRLGELERQLAGHRLQEPVMVSVLGTGGPDLDTFETNLEADAKAMTAFEEAMGDAAEIDGFEIKLSRHEDLAAVLRDLKAFDAIDVFLEVPMDENLEEALGAVAETDWMGAKGRSGGVEPSAIPSSHDLARFIKSAIDLDLYFKFTAGLHDPIRHFDSRVGADLHGYLNVLMAAAMALEEDLSVEELAAVLDEKDETVFSVQGHALRWHSFVVDAEPIEDLRSRLVSIGSCSVMEPLEGLEKLGLMGATR